VADVLAKMKEAVKETLPECCAEILEWQNTAVLRDGVVRAAAKLTPVTEKDLRIVEAEIARQAMKFVVKATTEPAEAGKGKPE